MSNQKSPAKKMPAAKKPARGGKTAAKPHGRDEIIESIIDATLSLWTAKGPAELSIRSIAARANVNYGLVHRHFGTKEAVIRAAMNRVVERSMGFIEDSTDLTTVIDSVLPRSTGSHARLLAWAILQYVVDDVLPEQDIFLKRLGDLASAGRDADDVMADKVAAGSVLAMLYGWRLFEPYLVRGLGLEELTHEQLDSLIRDNMMAIVKNQR
jgi:AcrR family transcriptional regulator